MHLCPTEQGEHLSIPHLNSSPLGLFRVKQKLRKSFLDEQILVFRIFNMISSIFSNTVAVPLKGRSRLVPPHKIFKLNIAF